MWKDFVEPGKPQMTIWCMQIAFWIHEATNTHTDYVLIMTFSTATVVACIVVVYAHCLACNFD
jgi:4-amino-4-deoxy-L-arabinose transferase-like glycosyltransferase